MTDIYRHATAADDFHCNNFLPDEIIFSRDGRKLLRHQVSFGVLWREKIAEKIMCRRREQAFVLARAVPDLSPPLRLSPPKAPLFSAANSHRKRGYRQ
jgi:hypothetical protein